MLTIGLKIISLTVSKALCMEAMVFELSKSAHINYGVPQRSILGPILFLIYINDFHHCFLNEDASMYADDTNIFLHHKDPNILLKNA